MMRPEPKPNWRLCNKTARNYIIIIKNKMKANTIYRETLCYVIPLLFGKAITKKKLCKTAAFFCLFFLMKKKTCRYFCFFICLSCGGSAYPSALPVPSLEFPRIDSFPEAPQPFQLG